MCRGCCSFVYVCEVLAVSVESCALCMVRRGCCLFEAGVCIFVGFCFPVMGKYATASGTVFYVKFSPSRCINFPNVFSSLSVPLLTFRKVAGLPYLEAFCYFSCSSTVSGSVGTRRAVRANCTARQRMHCRPLCSLLCNPLLAPSATQLVLAQNSRGSGARVSWPARRQPPAK